MIGPVSPPQPSGAKPSQDVLFMNKAKALEAAFLSELMGYSGVGSLEGEFDGGIGEDQFASFLREEQARMMVDRGGIGLAELIFDSLKQKVESPDVTP